LQSDVEVVKTDPSADAPADTIMVVQCADAGAGAEAAAAAAATAAATAAAQRPTGRGRRMPPWP